MKCRIWTTALAVALLLCAPEARADEAAVGLVPLGAVVPIAAVGGVITTVLLAIDISDGNEVHPGVRDVSLVFAGFNILAGTGAIIAGALIEDDDIRPAFYGVGGAVVAIGLTGGVLGLVVDTYEVGDNVATLQVSPAAGGACWSVTGSF